MPTPRPLALTLFAAAALASTSAWAWPVTLYTARGAVDYGRPTWPLVVAAVLVAVGCLGLLHREFFAPLLCLVGVGLIVCACCWHREVSYDLAYTVTAVSPTELRIIKQNTQREGRAIVWRVPTAEVTCTIGPTYQRCSSDPDDDTCETVYPVYVMRRGRRLTPMVAGFLSVEDARERCQEMVAYGVRAAR